MRRFWPLPALLLLLQLVLGAAADNAGGEPGPGACHAQCTTYGNCGDHGHCRCPFGRLGEGCEIDFLAPCRQGPDRPAYCGTGATKSCECMRRCRQYFCRSDSKNETICEAYGPPGDRWCYHREGVEPDKQYSLVPELNETGVVYYSSDRTDSNPENTTDRGVLKDGDVGTMALSECPDNCNRHGYCQRWTGDANSVPYCTCHRGFSGASCETQKNVCYLECNGRGKCLDEFCHCKPPYFSIGCSRSKVYPPDHSIPSPVNFKIYMYDINTQNAYENEHWVGWGGHDANYIAYALFLEQFLMSPVRTEDPSEANLFYIPSFTYGYSGNTGSGSEHITLLMDHIRMKWPYWNRTQGRDHFFWTSADRGACFIGGPALQPIKLTHFGFYLKNETRHNMASDIWKLPNQEYGCYHPLRDVLTVPYDGRIPWLFEKARNMTVDQLIEGKKTLFFVAGDTRMDDREYSGYTRQILWNLTQEWADPEFQYVHGNAADYEESLRTAKFCLAPYGHGYGMRLHQSILTGCVPLIIAEHVYQPYEEVIPYESFSLRLDNGDLPRLREILRGVSDEQYRGLLENAVRYREAFVWDRKLGGRAFDYTIATLRRRHMNLKALYY